MKPKTKEKVSNYALATSHAMMVVGLLGAALYFIRIAVFQFGYAKHINDWWIDPMGPVANTGPEMAVEGGDAVGTES